MSNEQSSKLPILSQVMNVARQSMGRLAQQRAKLEGASEWRSLVALPEKGFGAFGELVTGSGSGGDVLQRTFLIFVVLPTILFFIYSALWQSPRYVAETRITVREGQDKKKSGDAGSMISKMMGGGSSNPDSQNAFMVQNYIKGRSIIIDLGGRAYLEKKFARPEVDYFSRLESDAKIEELWKYWLGHVVASVDTVSSIVTIRADAFVPQDALDIANDVIRLSEDLVNKITLRNRNDALARTESDVKLMRQKLVDARQKVLTFRNQNLMIDPGDSAKSLTETMTKLNLERVDILKSLDTFSGSLSKEAPTQRLLRTRLGIIDQQIAEIKRKLASVSGSDTVSSQIAAYENLKLEEQFAESLYTIAQTTYDKARQEVEKQQLYLVTIVTPSLPESATYPRIISNTALFFFALLLPWAVISLLVASISDQMV